MGDLIQQEICKNPENSATPRKGYELVGLTLVADLYKKGAFDNISSLVKKPGVNVNKRKYENCEENVCKLVKMNAEAWENRGKVEDAPRVELNKGIYSEILKSQVKTEEPCEKPPKKKYTKISDFLKHAYFPSESKTLARIWENREKMENVEETCEKFPKNPVIYNANMDISQTLVVPEVYQVCEEKIGEPETCSFLRPKAEEPEEYEKIPKIPVIYKGNMDFPLISVVPEVPQIQEKKIDNTAEKLEKNEDISMEKWLCKPYFFFNKKPEAKKVSPKTEVKKAPKTEVKKAPKKVEVINLRKFLPKSNRRM